MNYGKVPSMSTARFHPETRPEVHMPVVNITAPQTRPQPLGFNTRSFESFEMPSTVQQPYHLSTQQPPAQNNNIKCPVCFNGIKYFKLPNDPTASVFCNTCRQPYHFCSVHKVSLPGMGLNLRDPAIHQCQCQSSQGFLGDKSWESCFNK
jgi:hypothetical protein